MDIGAALVTGGAGFIGSHLVEKLLSIGTSVKVMDNLSTGRLENIKGLVNTGSIIFSRKDMGNGEELRNSLADVTSVFHIAGYTDVRTGFKYPSIPFDENIRKTFLLLEALRKSPTANSIIFTSSSTVYGMATSIPTTERYGPLLPLSHYGASKLACEALICSYSHTYGITSKIFRLANIVGSRGRKGIVWDFVHKLKKETTHLDILGNGQQSKSYLHVSDCIEGILAGSLFQSKGPVEIYNLGNRETTDVNMIGSTICELLKLSGVKMKYTKQKHGIGGWVGDVPLVFLNINKLKGIGWMPTLSSKESIVKSARELIEESSSNKAD